MKNGCGKKNEYQPPAGLFQNFYYLNDEIFINYIQMMIKKKRLSIKEHGFLLNHNKVFVWGIVSNLWEYATMCVGKSVCVLNTFE